MFRLDLHTHSVGSPDGGLTAADYAALLNTQTMHFIAITDHDSIDTAQELQKSLGDRIIVGQEITTSQGEIIGLYLDKLVTSAQTAQQTVKAIKQQGGLVYIPHPFETVRKGIPKDVLDSIAESVDIIETHNGRAIFQNKGPAAVAWARLHGKVACASSDAHGKRGMATSFTAVSKEPTRDTLVELLKTGHQQTARPPLHSLLYPKYHRLRGKLKKTK